MILYEPAGGMSNLFLQTHYDPGTEFITGEGYNPDDRVYGGAPGDNKHRTPKGIQIKSGVTKLSYCHH